VLVKQGRFGYYVRAGKIIAGLRKLDPSTLTLEEAIEILQTRGKAVGSKKKKKGGKKAKEVKEKVKSTAKKSGYQVYVSEVMKNGVKMGEAAAAWKSLDAEAQQTFKDKATALAELEPKTEKTSVKKAASSAAPRPKSGYQMYVSEVMKGGMKMGEAASTWKEMGAEQQQTYKDSATSSSPSSSSSSSASSIDAKKDTTSRPKSGYQMYVSEVMKGGMKMGEAASTWKEMGAEQQQTYKDSATSSFPSSSANSIDAKKDTTARPKSGYQMYVSEVMKGGMKMGEAASTWKEMGAEQQQTYKDSATSSSPSSSANSIDAKKDTTSRPKSGYQMYVSEVMKGGMKMGEAASTWKTFDSAAQQTYKDRAALTHS
jgi:ATP:corrinoid adenosyltransferase